MRASSGPLREPARVMMPAPEIVVVAVVPKYAVLVMERSVDDAPPERIMSDVVALCPAAGCVKASYDRTPEHALPVFVTTPAVSIWRQLLEEAAAWPETVRLVVLAVPVLEIWKSVVVEKAEVDEAMANAMGLV